jgi:hypothetical protein
MPPPTKVWAAALSSHQPHQPVRGTFSTLTLCPRRSFSISSFLFFFFLSSFTFFFYLIGLRYSGERQPEDFCSRRAQGAGQRAVAAAPAVGAAAAVPGAKRCITCSARAVAFAAAVAEAAAVRASNAGAKQVAGAVARQPRAADRLGRVHRQRDPCCGRDAAGACRRAQGRRGRRR